MFGDKIACRSRVHFTEIFVIDTYKSLGPNYPVLSKLMSAIFLTIDVRGKVHTFLFIQTREKEIIGLLNAF